MMMDSHCGDSHLMESGHDDLDLMPIEFYWPSVRNWLQSLTLQVYKYERTLKCRVLDFKIHFSAYWKLEQCLHDMTDLLQKYS